MPSLLDASALLTAVAVSGAHPAIVAFGLIAFVLLNADSSRLFRLDPRVRRELGWLLARTAVPLLGLLALGSVGAVSWFGPGRALDGVVLAGSAGIGLVVLGRAVAYGTRRVAQARRLISEPTIVLGTGVVAAKLGRALDVHPEYGLRPVGFIDGPTANGDLPRPLLGGPHHLERLVTDLDVRRVVVAFGHERDHDVSAILRQLEKLRVEVHVVPRLFELGSVHRATDDVGGIPLVHLRRPANRAVARPAKRVFDVLAASVILVACLPVMLVAAVAVRCSSPGPVLFRQTRVGRDGRTFEILKLRTMHMNDESDTAWSVDRNQFTRVGQLLRRMNVDELPQLINVIRGEMSLVGPRPERPYFAGSFSAAVPTYAHRHRVKGGMTGLGQTEGNRGPNSSIPERARFDNLYIDRWSLWADILIVFRTLRVTFGRSGQVGDPPRVRMVDGASSRQEDVIDLTSEPPEQHVVDLTETEPSEDVADAQRGSLDGRRSTDVR